MNLFFCAFVRWIKLEKEQGHKVVPVMSHIFDLLLLYTDVWGQIKVLGTLLIWPGLKIWCKVCIAEWVEYQF